MSRLYFAFNIGIGFYYKARAGSSVSEFFLSGRNVPWWLAGTSMVATTFAADTPLAVTGMVARGGIAGNWLWWNFVASGMLTVFFYARLWRRSGVMTDIEFAEIRYSGKPAAFLRGFRALYLGIPINCIILGWVNLAMVKILMLMLGVGQESTALARRHGPDRSSRRSSPLSPGSGACWSPTSFSSSSRWAWSSCSLLLQCKPSAGIDAHEGETGRHRRGATGRKRWHGLRP